ncbi:MAG: hypothetical protein JMDDDDMK_05250 [Acidobacteria bacterium]|nr:hypothetical protein [Acidobacteriota bacterium]
MHNKVNCDNGSFVVYTPSFIRVRAAHEIADTPRLGFAGGFFFE